MKTLATIVLSLIAIIASVVLVFSTMCAFAGGLSNGDRGSFVLCAVISLVFVIVSMSAINRLNRKRGSE